MYNLYLFLIIAVFTLLLLSNSVLSKRLKKNSSLQLLLALLIILFSYNNVHIGFLMLAILGTVLLSVKGENLSYTKIMDSFGFNADFLSFNFNFENPFSGLTSKLELDADDEDERTEIASEAESEFDDNVSEIDPNDYISELDPTVNLDIDSMMSNYMNQNSNPIQNANPNLSQSADQNQQEASEQFAEMFNDL